MISVIIPTLNEEKTLESTIDSARVDAVEIIVSDGGSTDGTMAIAQKAADLTISSGRGRGVQMKAAAEAAKGDIFVFLHADTLLPEGWASEVYRLLGDDELSCGAFRFAIEEKGVIYELISAMVNLRSRYMKLPYGDQAFFMRRHIYEESGGYKPLPIMEDMDLVRRLGKSGKIVISDKAVITSSRRWRSEGWLWTTLRNQILLYLYILGISPLRLSRFYGIIR